MFTRSRKKNSGARAEERWLGSTTLFYWFHYWAKYLPTFLTLHITNVLCILWHFSFHLKFFYSYFSSPFHFLKKNAIIQQTFVKKIDRIRYLYTVICVEWNGGLEMKTPFLYGLVTAERMTSWHLCRKINIKYGHFYELYTVDSRGVSQQEHITASYRLLLTYRLIKTGLFT